MPAHKIPPLKETTAPPSPCRLQLSFGVPPIGVHPIAATCARAASASVSGGDTDGFCSACMCAVTELYQPAFEAAGIDSAASVDEFMDQAIGVIAVRWVWATGSACRAVGSAPHTLPASASLRLGRWHYRLDNLE
eukprot:365720-Chlamydomonas_euryale.AAC.23